MEANKRANRIPGDAISDLPDDLLCHVLSFLSTKEAALTSVLSKRWSNLLQSVPILDLDDSVLRNPQNGQRQIRVFKEFVDRLLSLLVDNSTNVKRVSLKCREYGVEQDRLIRWIRTVIDLGVLDLALHIDFRVVPFNIFRSNTLVKLFIGTRIRLVQCPSDFVVSPMLSSLCLASVAFGADKAKYGLKPILSAFPSLQNLKIHESKTWNYWDGLVSSPALKSLIYRSDDVDSTVQRPCVSFDTPGLVYLEYSDTVADKYQNVNLNSLVEAGLDLRLTANQIMRKPAPDNIGFVPGDVTTLFMGIKNVKILCLSPDALEALYYRGETIPVFTNLISLSLGSDKPHGSPFIFWILLQSLLLKSLKLETLTIKGLVHYVKEGWEGYIPRSHRFCWDDVSDTLSSSAVKVLNITGYQGTYLELNQMKRFLEKLSQLEMVRVDHKVVGNGERCRLMKDLLHLPKASSKCMIKFRNCLNV